MNAAPATERTLTTNPMNEARIFQLRGMLLAIAQELATEEKKVPADGTASFDVLARSLAVADATDRVLDACEALARK